MKVKTQWTDIFKENTGKTEFCIKKKYPLRVNIKYRHCHMREKGGGGET